MKQNVKKALRFTAAALPVAALAGLLVGGYMFDGYGPDMQAEILAQIGSYGTFLAVTAVQSTVYAAVCGFLGHLMAGKLGLMRPFRFEKEKLLSALALTVLCGVVFALDPWLFGRVIPEVAASYDAGISASYFFGSILYGGVVEEILLRLFFMSLL